MVKAMLSQIVMTSPSKRLIYETIENKFDQKGTIAKRHARERI
jgi:hypothetical protein